MSNLNRKRSLLKKAQLKGEAEAVFEELADNKWWWRRNMLYIFQRIRHGDFFAERTLRLVAAMQSGYIAFFRLLK